MIGKPWAYLGAALVFLSAILGGVSLAEMPTRFPGVPRIVAVGDLHGDLDATRRALTLAGAIDEGDVRAVATLEGGDRWHETAGLVGEAATAITPVEDAEVVYLDQRRKPVGNRVAEMRIVVEGRALGVVVERDLEADVLCKL